MPTASASTRAAPLAAEPLVQLLRTTRQEILRDHIAAAAAVRQHQGRVHAPGFERLRADVLLPMVHEQRVIGGLAVGPRASGDLYEGAELDALSTAAQQAVQALMRVEATERLREREREFTDLKRFFPPQIIDQVMARGGAAELRSQRKLVTVVFADLRGFTSFSDSVEPEEVMATLAEYHTLMGRRIAEFAGTLERFAGDGFMVFFNDPVDQPDHAERAARMALAMYDGSRPPAHRLAPQGLPDRRRHRHPHRLRHLRLHRLRGPARLRGDRQRQQPRVAPERRRRRRRDPHLGARPRRARATATTWSPSASWR